MMLHLYQETLLEEGGNLNLELWFVYEGRCKATWKRGFKLPWHEAGPPNHHDDKVDSDQ